mmetsp:Transcript_54199/g.129118  ORF Transcript_54199/g.129118 Transcript_54199/m.129118 type:complete len:623 (-) Transcript_54199:94-1962(-)
MVGISVQLITKELMLACRQLGHVISETLSSLVVSTIVDPRSGTFYVERSIDESDARTVIEDAAKKILSKEQPGISCLRLQAAYEGGFADLDATLQKETAQSGTVEDRLVGTISSFEASFNQDFESLMVLYKKIYQLLLIRCTQPTRTANPPKDDGIQREVAAALESVFPRVGLRAFVALTGPERAAQLQELASIVLGIRLFNQHQGKGGVGLPTVQQSIVEAQAHEMLTAVQEQIEEENALCKVFADYIKALPAGSSDLERSKVNLIYHRQYLSYLLNLEEDVSRALDRVHKAHQQLEDEFTDLEALVGGRVSVPKEQVYPRFDSVARTYHTAWKEVQALQACAKLRTVLAEARAQYFPQLGQAQLDDAGVSLSAPPAAEQDGQQAVVVSPELEAIPAPGAGGAGPVRLTQENFGDFLQVALDFQGFCIHTLVSKDRLLVPGNPSLGVIKYGEKHTVFASEQAALEFCADPDSYLQGVKEACYKQPELIHLLGLHQEFPGSSLHTIVRTVASTSGVMQADVGTSTPLHFQDSNIDKNYEWNEWKLRSNALQMANIKKKSTSTTQTALSHLRRENETQVYLPREVATNTNVNSGTNPPRLRKYIRGLRGEPQPMTIAECKFDL